METGISIQLSFIGLAGKRQQPAVWIDDVWDRDSLSGLETALEVGVALGALRLHSTFLVHAQDVLVRLSARKFFVIHNV